MAVYDSIIYKKPTNMEKMLKDKVFTSYKYIYDEVIIPSITSSKIYINNEFQYIENDIKYLMLIVKDKGKLSLIFTINDVIHREGDKPAEIHFSLDSKLIHGTIIKEFYHKKGDLHRENGYAIYDLIDVNNSEYYLNGNKLSYLKYKYKMLIGSYEKYDPIHVDIKKQLQNEKEQNENELKKTRSVALTNSKEIINDLNNYNNKLNNYLISSIYKMTLDIHNKFKEDKELNVKYLNQLHNNYTSTLINLLKDLIKNIDLETNRNMSKVERIESHITHLNDELNKIVDVSKHKIDKFVYDLEILVSALYNINNDYQDFRLTPGYSYMNFDSISNIKTYYISNEKPKKINNNYTDIEGWKVEKQLLKELHKNAYIIEYVASFVNENLDITGTYHIFKTRDTYFCLDYQLNLYTLDSINEELINDKNTYIFSLKNKVSKYEKEKEKYQHNLNNVKEKFINKNVEDNLEVYIEKLTEFNHNDEAQKLDTSVSEKALESILNVELLKI